MIHILPSPLDFDERIPDGWNCLYWSDDLGAGPVPATTSLEDLSMIRESFWRTFGGGRFIPESGAGSVDLAQRDAALRRLHDSSDEIAIWLGPNRPEILSLCAILSFMDPEIARTTPLTIVPCPNWGPAACNSKQLANWFADRAPLAPEFAGRAREMWKHYTAADPTGWSEMSQRIRGENTWLDTVFAWVLEEYPGRDNGLSPVEEALLQNAVEGNSVARIVARTMGHSEDRLSPGPLAERLWCFLSAGAPLLESPAGTGSRDDFYRLVVRPTALGRQVLRGERDHVSINGIDRWIGGVHLHGRSVPWRYDRNSKQLSQAGE
jgi:hypothetical protein